MELLDYLEAIKKRIWLVLLIVLSTCTISGTLFMLTSKPTYQAVSRIIVNKTNEVDGKKKIDQTLVGANIMLINTYKELIKSEPILQSVVAQNPQLHLNAQELVSNVKITSTPNSQVMTITVKESTNERAVIIANAVAHVFQNEVPKIMSVDNLSILSEASLTAPPQSSQTSLTLVLLISFIVSTFLSIILAFLLDYFDLTIRTEADVEKALGDLPLVSIHQIKNKVLKLVNSPVTSIKAGDVTHAQLSHKT
jgi:capsular polysaccharide biosynthesis protein